MALGSTEPLTEMSTRNLPGGKGRPEHKADDLTPSLIRLARKYEHVVVTHSSGPPRPVTAIALLSLFFPQMKTYGMMEV
jgi:hypothetical protein